MNRDGVSITPMGKQQRPAEIGSEGEAVLLLLNTNKCRSQGGTGVLPAAFCCLVFATAPVAAGLALKSSRSLQEEKYIYVFHIISHLYCFSFSFLLQSSTLLLRADDFPNAGLCTPSLNHPFVLELESEF